MLITICGKNQAEQIFKKLKRDSFTSFKLSIRKAKTNLHWSTNDVSGLTTGGTLLKCYCLSNIRFRLCHSRIVPKLFWDFWWVTITENSSRHYVPITLWHACQIRPIVTLKRLGKFIFGYLNTLDTSIEK